VNDTLRNTLKDLVKSGTDSNAAFNRLLDDYASYHLVLVIVGGVFLVGLLVMSVFFWRRFAKAPKNDKRGWTFERKTFFCFGVVSILVCLFLAVVVAANVSNVRSPRAGLAGAIPLLSTPHGGAQDGELYESFNAWLESGSDDLPPAVQSRVDDRLAWQRPKAIISGVLLVVLVLLSAFTWRTLIRRTRAPEFTWKLKDALLLVVGVLTVAACLVLMLMVMGNTQASLAPISMTLFYG
jgi:heme/copper-type cytochrome/quinol oxidase subunit 2